MRLVRVAGRNPAHDPEKACPGLDPAQTFSDKIIRKDKKIQSEIASI